VLSEEIELLIAIRQANSILSQRPSATPQGIKKKEI
jgi:hypothetical protein